MQAPHPEQLPWCIPQDVKINIQAHPGYIQRLPEGKVIKIQISQISAKIWMWGQQGPVVTAIKSYLQVERFNAIQLLSRLGREQLLRLHPPG